MPTVTIEFGPYSDLAGDDSYTGAQGYAVAVHPETHKPIEVLHLETGQVFTGQPVTFALDETGAGSVGPLAKPNTGETSPDNFAISITFPAYGPSPGDRIVAIPEGATDTVDYDELVAAEPEPALSVPLAASLEQVAEAITLSQAAAEAAAAEAEDAAASAVAAAASAVSADTRADSAETAALSAVTTAGSAVTTAGNASTAAASAVTTARNAFVAASVVGDNLILTDSDGDQTTAGNVRGPQGIKGDTGDTAPADSGTWTGAVSLGTPTVSTKTRTLSGNVTLSGPSNPASSTTSYTATYVIKQPASGGPYTVTWPVGLKWANDALAPTMPTVANSELTVHLLWTGLAWRAYNAGPFFP